MISKKWLALGFVMCFVGVNAGSSFGAAPRKIVGSKAAEFTLKDTAGTTVTLSELKGKVVFLDFWATWCPPCRQSIPKVEELAQRFKDDKVMVIGINVENNPKAVEKFMRNKKLGYTVLIGDEKVARDYRISGIPAFFILDKDGMILKKYEGFYPGMETEWEKVITQALSAK